MVWDWVFGTWFNEPRRPPVGIGVPDAVPAGFASQLLWPFRQLARGMPTSPERVNTPG